MYLNRFEVVLTRFWIFFFSNVRYPIPKVPISKWWPGPDLGRPEPPDWGAPAHLEALIMLINLLCLMNYFKEKQSVTFLYVLAVSAFRSHKAINSRWLKTLQRSFRYNTCYQPGEKKRKYAFRDPNPIGLHGLFAAT